MKSLVAQAETYGLTQDQLSLIKATVAKGASDDELRLFLHRASIMGVDPLKPGHIHFVKYGNSPGTIIIGIDGFRSRAARTGKHVGTKRGILRDDSGKCIGAWCEVYRSDWTQPAHEEVSLEEYNTGKGNWSRMPETMIKKVAEVAALRMAFPDELGGIYSDDEMDQAHDAKPAVEARPVEHEQAFAPGDDSGDPLENIGNYVCQIGRNYKGQRLRDIDPAQLKAFTSWLKAESAKQGKELQNGAKELVEHAEVWLSEGGDK